MNNPRSDDRILVATDFSPAAEAALKQAVWLARQTGAQIVLANAIPDLQHVGALGAARKRTESAGVV